jgi:hypothetical protein
MSSNPYTTKNGGSFLLLILYASGFLISGSFAFNNAGRTFSVSPRIQSGIGPSHLTSSFQNAPSILRIHKNAVQFDEKVGFDVLWLSYCCSERYGMSCSTREEIYIGLSAIICVFLLSQNSMVCIIPSK